MRSFHWKRKLIYYYGKIVRDGGTPQYIARGWGIGMFIGCVIPMSFQLLISVPLSFLLRGSKIGATLGTLITNPVTVVFIYPVQCWVGNKLIGGALSYQAIRQACRAVIEHQDWSTLMQMGGELIASFFAGGLLLGVVMTPITYFAVYLLVVRYRRLKAALKARREAAKQAKQP